jgi:hypothetical protein
MGMVTARAIFGSNKPNPAIGSYEVLKNKNVLIFQKCPTQKAQKI